MSSRDDGAGCISCDFVSHEFMCTHAYSGPLPVIIVTPPPVGASLGEMSCKKTEFVRSMVYTLLC